MEEYFESTTLTARDIRDPEISQWIGARMAELHSVDIEVVEGVGWEVGVEKNVHSWLAPAREVLKLSSLPESIERELDLDAFKRDWDRYSRWLAKVDDVHAGSRRVFAHNDTQYGNLLRLKHPKDGADDHRQVRPFLRHSIAVKARCLILGILLFNLRSSLLTLNMRHRTLLHSTSRTTSTNGL